MRERIPAPLRDALGACVAGESPWPLFAFGPAGTGKSCAGLYLCDRAGRGALFRDFGFLCETIRQAKMGELWTRGSHDSCCVHAEDIWNYWAAAPVAVLDELGVRAHTSDHVYEVAKTALDRRQNKPLLILTNSTLKQIGATFDDRVASRCGAGTVCHVSGPDQRVAG